MDGISSLPPCRADLKNVIVAVIKSENNFLLAKRHPSKNDGGLWTPVTGWINKGEPEVEALAREVSEEIGATVINSKRLLAHMAKTGKVNLIWFQTQLSPTPEPFVKAPDEITEIGWFSLDQIKELSAKGHAYPELYDRMSQISAL